MAARASVGKGGRAQLQRQPAYNAPLGYVPRGANPGELPTCFERILNLKVAQAIGVKFPQAVLLRADKVTQ
jgi:hypothetical protein